MNNYVTLMVQIHPFNGGLLKLGYGMDEESQLI